MGQTRPGAALWAEDVDVLVGTVTNRECDAESVGRKAGSLGIQTRFVKQRHLMARRVDPPHEHWRWSANPRVLPVDEDPSPRHVHLSATGDGIEERITEDSDRLASWLDCVEVNRKGKHA